MTTRTVRLDEATVEALERITKAENISANAAIRRAVVEYDKKRASTRDALLRRIVTEDRPLLDRLA